VAYLDRLIVSFERCADNRDYGRTSWQAQAVGTKRDSRNTIGDAISHREQRSAIGAPCWVPWLWWACVVALVATLVLFVLVDAVWVGRLVPVLVAVSAVGLVAADVVASGVGGGR
jgi:hypothetical protein